ncbi:MAG: MAPEG family protein [Pseudomonadaceae bacterium]|jgi:glutathione S-transferase|nr:MAPEG family protein [Pseudomonadaceae bacterium]
MALVDLLMVLVLLQYVHFSVLVAKARVTYEVKAPATSGNETFERYYRVQMNTLELLILLLPGIWLASKYLPASWVAVLCAIYLLGRVVYLRAYVADPGKRSLGFLLSFAPIIVLLLSGLCGSVRALLPV